MILSIAIPVIKTTYLQETLHSIAKQWTPDIELIIIDNTLGKDIHPILDKELSSRHIPYQLYTHNNRQGFHENMNLAISFMHGDWGYILCDDDIVPPHTFDELLPLLKSRHPLVSACVCEVDLINESSQKIGRLKSMTDWEYASGVDWIIHYFHQERSVMLGNCYFRIPAIRSTPGFRPVTGGFWSDVFLIYELGTKGILYHINKACIQWRKHSTQESLTAATSIIEKDFLVFERELIQSFSQLPDSQFQPFDKELCFFMANEYIKKAKSIFTLT